MVKKESLTLGDHLGHYYHSLGTRYDGLGWGGGGSVRRAWVEFQFEVADDKIH